MNKTCIKCDGEFVYHDGYNYVCPSCGFEWSDENNGKTIVKDSVGNILNDGDTITIIKDLKVKGSSQNLKMGTKVKNIRIVEGDHNIDCRIDGFGAMSLKSEFVKKVS